jgi:beta-mannosidase
MGFSTSWGFLGLMIPFSGALEIDLSSQAGVAWTVSNCDRSINVPGSVPGVVHTDLMSAGIIKENPYFRYNELEQSWVSKETCWRYEASLDVSQFTAGEDLFLHVTGLDTVSTLYLNQQQVAQTSNSFRTYNLPLPWTSLSSAAGASNLLSIEIASPIDYPKQQAAAYPYAVPATENYNVWAEPSSRNFMRKAGSDFGWDWGPAFAPSGLTGQVSLFQPASHIGKLESLVMLQAVTIAEEGTRGAAVVTPRLRVVGVSTTPTAAAVTVKINNETLLSETVALELSENSPGKYVVLELSEIHLSDVELWFPRGYGKPSLYTVDIEYCPASSFSSSSSAECQTLSKRVGFRTVQLVQEALDTTEETTAAGSGGGGGSAAGGGGGGDAAFAARSQAPPSTARAHPSLSLVNPPPASFFLKVNNIPVFAKGANFIPIDVFTSRVTHSDRKYVLEAAAAAHMNMVRVWGGGIYQTDDFYERADEMGMLVGGGDAGLRSLPPRRLLPGQCLRRGGGSALAPVLAPLHCGAGRK